MTVCSAVVTKIKKHQLAPSIPSLERHPGYRRPRTPYKEAASTTESDGEHEQEVCTKPGRCRSLRFAKAPVVLEEPGCEDGVISLGKKIGA
jgi:hypothetical protein